MTASRAPGTPYYRGFTITLTHTKLGRTRLDEWSVWLTELYLTTNNTHNRQTDIQYGGIRTCNPSKLRDADLRHRPQGYGDGHSPSYRKVSTESAWRLSCLFVCLFLLSFFTSFGFSAFSSRTVFSLRRFPIYYFRNPYIQWQQSLPLRDWHNCYVGNIDDILIQLHFRYKNTYGNFFFYAYCVYKIEI